MARAGWGLADWTWEKLAERAAAAWCNGDAFEAASDWAEALCLARTHMVHDDPRLAASLTNHAVGLARAGKPQVADRLLAEALSVWSAARFWVATMTLDNRARSSIYHLRLENRHRQLYEREHRTELLDHVVAGLAAARALRVEPAHARAAPDAAAWRDDRPVGFSDTRKLLAAVRLQLGC